MMRLAFPLLLLSLLISCSGKNDVPGDVLPPQKMQDLLWDLSRADQYSQDLSLHDTIHKQDELNKELYEKVFSIHKTTPSDFDKSYEYYRQHPDMLRLILDSLYTRKLRIIESNALQKPGELPGKKEVPIN